MEALANTLSWIAVWAVVYVGEVYVRTGENQWRIGYWVCTALLVAGFAGAHEMGAALFLAVVYAANGYADQRRRNQRKKERWPRA